MAGKPTVYIETTIPSFYHETRRDAANRYRREVTREWWDLHRHRFDLCTSELTLLELRDAPSAKSLAAIKLIGGLRRLEPSGRVAEITDLYISQRLMPAGAGGDAGHLAFTSVHCIDFLLTWNCKHLANANKFPHLRALNARLGLPIPVLTTPYMLMPEGPINEAKNA